MLSQVNYIPGYLVNISNDTTRCFVSSKSLKKAEILSFKINKNAEEKRYYPFEILGYGTDSIHFETHQEKLPGTALLKNKEFYQVIFKGKVSLFKRYGANLFLSNDTTKWVYSFNKGTLLYLTQDQPELKKLVETAKISEYEIVEILIRYHSSKNFTYYRNYQPQKNKQVVSIAASLGYSYSTLNLEIEQLSKSFTPSYSPQIGLNINFFPKSYSRELCFNFQVWFSRELFQYQDISRSQNLFIDEEILLESYFLKVPFGVKINLSNRKNSLFYLNIGSSIQGNFSNNYRWLVSKGNNSQLTTYQEKLNSYLPYRFSLQGGIGVEKLFKKDRYFIEAYYNSTIDLDFQSQTFTFLLGRVIFKNK